MISSTETSRQQPISSILLVDLVAAYSCVDVPSCFPTAAGKCHQQEIADNYNELMTKKVENEITTSLCRGVEGETEHTDRLEGVPELSTAIETNPTTSNGRIISVDGRAAD